MTTRRRLACALTVGALAWAVPTIASACGGTFCDTGPQAMPVEQTGETVLFVVGEDAVETHVQIQYDPETPAERFAWVIPVPARPEFAIGSQALFDAALAATAPAYGFTTFSESCDEPEPDPCGAGNEGGEKLDAGSSDDGRPDDGPAVVEHALVGAFEIHVLDGGTAEGVFDWLETEGFAPDPAATPILDSYLDAGFMFVALELATGAQADEVHPIVLRVPSPEPCVPIRLTAIATQDDLELRTLFLADGRAVPDNYLHVVLNDIELDWLGQGANYRELVTLAVDEAGGRAFVTEYAGTPDLIDASALESMVFDSALFAEGGWLQAVARLTQFQLVTCDLALGTCDYAHPLLPSILDTHLPTPGGLTRAEFFTCPDCYWESFDATAFDGPAFAAELDEKVVAPTAHAIDLLREWPWITRLYTTMSAHEMTVDPTFLVRDDLPVADILTRMGRQSLRCDGEVSFDVPDGRRIALTGATWPDVGGDLMPAAERIESFGPTGAAVVEVDRRPDIDALIAAWNEANGQGPPPDQRCGDSDSAGPLLGDDPTQRDDDVVGGCGCASRPATGWAWLPMLLVAALYRRRSV